MAGVALGFDALAAVEVGAAADGAGLDFHIGVGVGDELAATAVDEQELATVPFGDVRGVGKLDDLFQVAEEMLLGCLEGHAGLELVGFHAVWILK